MRSKSKITFGLAALALTLTACSQSDANSAGGGSADGSCDEVYELTAGIAPGRAAGELELAKQSGIMEKHCLDITVQDLNSPAASLASLTGGSIDLTFTPVNVLINAVSEGLPVRVIAQDLGVPENAAEVPEPEITSGSLYVGQDSPISSPSDLEGKTVAVEARGASLELRVAAAMEADGADPQKVNWVQLDFPTAADQLVSGQVDAAGLVTPHSNRAISEGAIVPFPTLIELYEPGTAYTAWTTSEQIASDKAEAINAFREMSSEIQEYVMNHRDEFDQASSDYTGVPVEDLQKEPDIYFPDDITQEDLERVSGTLTRLGYLDAEPDLSEVILEPQ